MTPDDPANEQDDFNQLSAIHWSWGESPQNHGIPMLEELSRTGPPPQSWFDEDFEGLCGPHLESTSQVATPSDALSAADAANRPWMLSESGVQALEDVMNPETQVGKPSEPSRQVPEVSIEEIRLRPVEHFVDPGEIGWKGAMDTYPPE